MKERQMTLKGQVIVVAGAGSRTGIDAARRAAEQGAFIATVSGSGTAMGGAAVEILNCGGKAFAVVADISQEEDVKGVLRLVAGHLGRIDTWINVFDDTEFEALAGPPEIVCGGTLESVYGVIANGSLEAIRHFRSRAGGGAIINVVETANAAIESLDEALWRECRSSDPDVRVTLIIRQHLAGGLLARMRAYIAGGENGARAPRSTDPVVEQIMRALEPVMPQCTASSGGRFLSRSSAAISGVLARILRRSPRSRGRHYRGDAGNGLMGVSTLAIRVRRDLSVTPAATECPRGPPAAPRSG